LSPSDRRTDAVGFVRLTLILTTRRLVLRPAGAGDAAVLGRQWNDAAVGRFLWDGRPVATATVDRVLLASRDSFRAHGYGLWVIARAGETIGACGLRPSSIEPGVELIYSLDRPAWGHGYAVEAARAVLAHARRLGLPRVVAAANPENVASWRVLEAAGLRRTGRARTPVEDLLLYST
jgi:ribosomal-protein-alanine N-acetyltransferase